MARDFKSAIQERRRDPLQDIDETVPGFIPDPSTYSQPTPGGARRARTFSQTIADATRGIDAGMAMPSGGKVIDESQVGRPAPDWRGHYLGADAPPTPYRFLDLATVTKMVIGDNLYVHRPLANAQQLWDWANAAGIPNLVPPHEMHATQVYSRVPVDLEPQENTIIAKRHIAPLGDKGAVVLHFDSPEMQARHREAMAAGASHDWPTFQTHVTLSYDAAGQDLTGIEPPTFPLEFGPEIHAPLNENWAEDKGMRKPATFAERIA